MRLITPPFIGLFNAVVPPAPGGPYLGSTSITACKYGTNDIQKAYLGTTLVMDFSQTFAASASRDNE